MWNIMASAQEISLSEKSAIYNKTHNQKKTPQITNYMRGSSEPLESKLKGFNLQIGVGM